MQLATPVLNQDEAAKHAAQMSEMRDTGLRAGHTHEQLIERVSGNE
jgi:hypothetical protein